MFVMNLDRGTHTHPLSLLGVIVTMGTVWQVNPQKTIARVRAHTDTQKKKHNLHLLSGL